MERRRLGKTGLDVSILGFGSAPVGYLDEDARRTGAILNHLLDQGVNLIDTAPCYPNSEELIARSVGHRRDEFLLVTKCGHQVEGISGAEWSPQLIEQSVDQSLRRLDTDRLDVLLLHSSGLETLQKADALEAMSRARDAGKTRFIGYAGDNEAASHAAGLEEVDVLEMSVSICDQININEGLQAAKETEVGVLAKRPLANAAWRKSDEQRGFYRSYASSYTERLKRMDIRPSEFGIDGPESEAFPELALRFTLSVEGVHCALVGTTNPENARTNLSHAEKSPLPHKQYEKIREAFLRAEQSSGERWVGLT